ncbi:MAG TPA: pseudouridine synthase [Edaphocola sp.]|nr:pseudouridine synthase [Edaphocola sp.]
MDKKFSNKKPAPRLEEDEFKEERAAAQKKFSETDRKSFWKDFDKDKGKGNQSKPRGAKEERSRGPKEERKNYPDQKKTFKEVMDKAYQERKEKKNIKEEQVFKRVTPDNFVKEIDGEQSTEHKPKYREDDKRKPYSDRKPSPSKDYNRNEGKPRTFTDKRGKPKQESFLDHFDDELPEAKLYDSSGKRGVRAEQQMIANMDVMPLNKYISHCGICSRRDAVVLIKGGKIKVNEQVVTEPGYKVQEGDLVYQEGKLVKIQKNLVYALLNKPKGFITTTDDPKGRRTVMDILGEKVPERVFPVGRLDRHTTGLLLLTNDGDLAQRLSHPKYENRKIYQVTLDKPVTQTDFDKILKGLELEDGLMQVDQLAYLEKKNEIGIEIHSGKNRIVRRIFESLGYVVDKLDRVVYAGLTKKNLKRGQWRFLTKQEVINLKHLKA